MKINYAQFKRIKSLAGSNEFSKDIFIVTRNFSLGEKYEVDFSNEHLVLFQFSNNGQKALEGVIQRV